MLISQSKYGVRMKDTMEDWEISDLETFARCFKTYPAKGSKDGSYFLMGHCSVKQRQAANVSEVPLIILDCDDRLDENMNTVKGAPPVEEVLQVLDEGKAAYLLYTTFNHAPDYPRYRIVFFPDSPIPSEQVAGVTRFMFDNLNEKGVMLANTSESSKVGQAWYFPRLKEEDSEYICKYNIERPPLVWKDIKIVEPSAKDWREDILSPNENSSLTGEWGMITIFLETHNNFGYINKLLESHGYERKYMTNSGAKYLAPNSTSGSPGVVLFQGKDGKWRVISYHSDSHDKLSQQTSGEAKLCLDAFDVLTRLEYKTSEDAMRWLKEGHFARLREYFLKRFVYIVASNEIGDIKENRTIKKAQGAFENYAAPAFGIVIATGGTPKKIQAAGDWMSSSRRQVLFGKSWRPVTDRIITEDDGRKYWNIYEGPDWKEINTEEHLHIFTDHIKFLIPDQDDEYLFMQWLAERFQYPEERARFTPLHIAAKQGTGRGWLVRLMRKLLGAKNVSSTTIKELCGDGSLFNNFLYQSQFCSINEVAEDKKSKYEIDDKLRSVLTEATYPVDIKNGFKGDAQIYTSFFMMSNHRDCLVIPEGDRRIFVIEGMNDYKKDSYYFFLDNMLKNKQFIREVYWYLMKLDISMIRNMSRPPDNDAKKRLRGTGLSNTGAFFQEILDLETTPGLIWTPALVQTYVNVKAGLGCGEICTAQEVTSEVKKLCKDHLTTAYNGKPFTCNMKSRRKGKSIRARAHPDFDSHALEDASLLNAELQETTTAIEEMVKEAIETSFAK